jgi:hypothetical protein
MDSNMVKNQDSTSVFIFINHAGKSFSNLNNGIYRLNFKFKRDIGGSAPVLKRYGFKNPEEGVIEFSLP